MKTKVAILTLDKIDFKRKKLHQRNENEVKY